MRYYHLKTVCRFIHEIFLGFLKKRCNDILQLKRPQSETKGINVSNKRHQEYGTEKSNIQLQAKRSSGLCRTPAPNELVTQRNQAVFSLTFSY